MDHQHLDRTHAAAVRKLENIQAITDEAFMYMDVEEFLDILVDRVREIMEADTAAVMLLDRPTQVLVAAIAKGIEDEVGQDARVPVGQGFAGRVAAERLPVLIDNVPDAGVFNPLLVERGLRSMLGVPLIAGGELLGVMQVGTVTRTTFSADDVEFLQLAAGRVALGVQQLLSRSDRNAARELQRSLVPPAPDPIPGAQLAARYSPGTSIVGGDWYDVFRLPSGDVGVVMGDVTGSGLKAAVVMGRMRSTVRAYAIESDDPAEVLDRLDRKMEIFEPDAMATVLYAVFDPDLARVRIASAGHWPPVLAVPGEETVPVDMRTDPLIGTGLTHRRSTTELCVPPGAVLCFYTDGLIERRDIPIDTGVATLCAAAYAGPPEQVAATIMGRLIGREGAGDDVALLVVRRLD